MKPIEKNSTVRILTGKYKGQLAQVTEVSGDGHVFVQIPGLPYERSYNQFTDIQYIKDAPMEGLPTGEVRRRKIQLAVKEGKVCPSFPHACSGECGIGAPEDSLRAKG